MLGDGDALPCRNIPLFLLPSSSHINQSNQVEVHPRARVAGRRVSDAFGVVGNAGVTHVLMRSARRTLERFQHRAPQRSRRHARRGHRLLAAKPPEGAPMRGKPRLITSSVYSGLEQACESNSTTVGFQIRCSFH